MVIQTAITTYIFSWLRIMLFTPCAVESAEDCANNKKPENKNITDRHSRFKKFILIINQIFVDQQI